MVVVSVAPEIGEPLPGNTAGPRLRQYTDEIEHVRLLYWVIALRTVVVVAYIEIYLLPAVTLVTHHVGVDLQVG